MTNLVLQEMISLPTTKGSESFWILDRTKDFYMLVGPKQTDPHKNTTGYLLYNKRTGVFEAEGLSEAFTRVALADSQTLLDKVLSGEYAEEPFDASIPLNLN